MILFLFEEVGPSQMRRAWVVGRKTRKLPAVMLSIGSDEISTVGLTTVNHLALDLDQNVGWWCAGDPVVTLSA